MLLLSGCCVLVSALSVETLTIKARAAIAHPELLKDSFAAQPERLARKIDHALTSVVQNGALLPSLPPPTVPRPPSLDQLLLALPPLPDWLAAAGWGIALLVGAVALARDTLTQRSLEDAALERERLESSLAEATARADAELARADLNQEAIDAVREAMAKAQVELARLEAPVRSLEREREVAMGGLNKNWDEREAKRLATLQGVMQRGARWSQRLEKLESERAELDEADVSSPSVGLSKGIRPFAIGVQTQWSIAANSAQRDAAMRQIGDADEEEARLRSLADDYIRERAIALEKLTASYDARSAALAKSIDLIGLASARGACDAFASVISPYVATEASEESDASEIATMESLGVELVSGDSSGVAGETSPPGEAEDGDGAPEASTDGSMVGTGEGEDASEDESPDASSPSGEQP